MINKTVLKFKIFVENQNENTHLTVKEWRGKFCYTANFPCCLADNLLRRSTCSTVNLLMWDKCLFLTLTFVPTPEIHIVFYLLQDWFQTKQANSTGNLCPPLFISI